MATSLLPLSLILFSVVCNLGSSCPCHTKKGDALTESTNSSIALNDVLDGLTVAGRLTENTLTKLPNRVFDASNTPRINQEAMAGLAVIQQYIGMIVALQGSGINTTELELYRLILQAILTDTCVWLNTFENITLDCSDAELKHFIPFLLSLGLRSELNRVECYLESFPRAMDPPPDKWAANTIQPLVPTNIWCEFCDRVRVVCTNCTSDK